MVSFKNSLKHESGVEPGKVRFITSREFVRAYNHSAWLFFRCISKYMVIWDLPRYSRKKSIYCEAKNNV